MEEIMKQQDEQAKYAQTYDIWFSGNHTEGLTGPNGGVCFWLCQYYEKRHLLDRKDPVTGLEFTTWCKKRDEFEDGSNCNESCDAFASCDTCGGFSAVRCGACDIIRYD